MTTQEETREEAREEASARVAACEPTQEEDLQQQADALDEKNAARVMDLARDRAAELRDLLDALIDADEDMLDEPLEDIRDNAEGMLADVLAACR